MLWNFVIFTEVCLILWRVEGFRCVLSNWDCFDFMTEKGFGMLILRVLSVPSYY